MSVREDADAALRLGQGDALGLVPSTIRPTIAALFAELDRLEVENERLARELAAARARKPGKESARVTFTADVLEALAHYKAVIREQQAAVRLAARAPRVFTVEGLGARLAEAHAILVMTLVD